jgi:hypothetical protein
MLMPAAFRHACTCVLCRKLPPPAAAGGDALALAAADVADAAGLVDPPQAVRDATTTSIAPIPMT